MTEVVEPIELCAAINRLVPVLVMVLVLGLGLTVTVDVGVMVETGVMVVVPVTTVVVPLIVKVLVDSPLLDATTKVGVIVVVPVVIVRVLLAVTVRVVSISDDDGSIELGNNSWEPVEYFTQFSPWHTPVGCAIGELIAHSAQYSSGCEAGLWCAACSLDTKDKDLIISLIIEAGALVAGAPVGNVTVAVAYVVVVMVLLDASLVTNAKVVNAVTAIVCSP